MNVGNQRFSGIYPTECGSDRPDLLYIFGYRWRDPYRYRFNASACQDGVGARGSKISREHKLWPRQQQFLSACTNGW
jgi:hypothetical protein